MKRFTLATVALMAMLVGMLAGPAFAQDAGDPAVPGEEELEGFTVLDCATEIAIIIGEETPEVFDEELAAFFEDDGETVVDGEEQALVDAVGAILDDNGQTFAEVCGIYAAVVLPEILEEEPEEPEVLAEAEEPTIVMGATLSRTGADTGVLIAAALGLFGLGFLALRRTRSEASEQL